jgi:Uri superfamily endonuclease
MAIGWRYERISLDRKARGTYVLVLYIHRRLEIEVGALGALTFKAGWYLYVGSAMSGLRARIRRHFNKRKLRYWHIDYLTNVAHIDGAAILESNDRLECIIAHKLQMGWPPRRDLVAAIANAVVTSSSLLLKRRPGKMWNAQSLRLMPTTGL